MYFALRSALLDLSADRLYGLRLSLNTPVVSIEDLPEGPARAAVAIHNEIDGRPNVTVGVRSLRSQAAVIFSLEGDLNEHSSLAVGIEAALSFGENMGFLFDEDEFGSGPAEEVRPRALGLWRDLMGPALGPSEGLAQLPVAPAPLAPPSLPDGNFEVEGLDDDSEVLLLEELADPEDELANAFADEPGEVGAEPPVLLSKFRHAASSEPPSPCADEGHPGVGTPPSAAKGTALGRLKLVKRFRGSPEAPPRPSLIRRLLSSY